MTGLLKIPLAILWKYIEYFAMNLWKRYLSKTFWPNRMIFFQMYRVKATFLSMFPKALLLLNSEWKFQPLSTWEHFLLLNLNSPMYFRLCCPLSQWMDSHGRPGRLAQRSECCRNTGWALCFPWTSCPTFGGTRASLPDLGAQAVCRNWHWSDVYSSSTVTLWICSLSSLDP